MGIPFRMTFVGANRAGMTSVHINRMSDELIPKMADERPDYSISNLYTVLSSLNSRPNESV